MQIFEKRLFKNRCTSYNLNKFNTNMFAICFGNKMIKSKIFPNGIILIKKIN